MVSSSDHSGSVISASTLSMTKQVVIYIIVVALRALQRSFLKAVSSARVL